MLETAKTSGEGGIAELASFFPLRPQPVFTGGNQVQLLQGGDQLFPAMQAAIDAAKHEVWLSVYIFFDNPVCMNMLHSMRAAQARGVKVHLVVDGFGSKASLPALQAALEGSNLALAVFRPLNRWWHWLQPRQLRRLHHKLCVVDSELAFAGGINLMDDRFDAHHGWMPSPRLDFSVSLRGPVVKAMQQAVRAIWTRAWLGHDFRDEVKLLSYSPHRLARLRRLLKRLRMPVENLHNAQTQELLPMQAALVLRDNFRHRRSIERSYITAIRNARERIDLISPYFYPRFSFRRALIQAAQRGVRVRLLFQGLLDYRLAGWAASVLYEELLSHGIEIFEYSPAFLHAKVAVIDGQWATVGSSNIDPLSLLLNLEANVIVRDAGFSAVLTERIEAALADSNAVSSETLPTRGWVALLRRRFIAWGVYVYLRVAGAVGRY